MFISALKSTVVYYSSWLAGLASGEPTSNNSYWLEEEQVEVGNGRSAGSSAIGDRGQTAVSLMPNAGTHIHIFESLHLEGSYVGGFL